MASMFVRASLLVLLLLPVTAAGSVSASGPAYVIEDLGLADARAVAINASGVAVGSALQTDGTYRAFLHDPGSGLSWVPGDRHTAAADINAAGTVVGEVAAPDGTPRAFRYAPGGSFEELGTLGGTFSRALGLNDAGVLVGSAHDGSAQQAAQAAAGAWAIVPGLGGDSVAADMNDVGDVAGTSYFADGSSRAFLVVAGVPHDLGTLGGAWSVATGLNDRGQVAGSAALNGGLQHAFRATPTGMTDLGTLGGIVSGAEDINNHGAVVGWYFTAGFEMHAFLYTDADGMVDLNTLLPAGSGWTLVAALGINDAGQIVGYGIRDGEPAVRAFRLSPAGGPDDTPPVIHSATPSLSVLWPPRHQLVSVTVAVQATDDSGVDPVCAVADVRSSEPDAGLDPDDVPGDVVLGGGLTIQLRAERDGHGTGRVYSLTVQCSDAAGHQSSADVIVRVPHDNGGSPSAAGRANRKK